VLGTHQLLAWLEVLSLVANLRCAVHSFIEVRLVDMSESCFSFIFESLLYTDFVVQRRSVKDSDKFVLPFFDVIESSMLHIYESALRFSPS
jgi:hypothetical protein